MMGRGIPQDCATKEATEWTTMSDHLDISVDRITSVFLILLIMYQKSFYTGILQSFGGISVSQTPPLGSYPLYIL